MMKPHELLRDQATILVQSAGDRVAAAATLMQQAEAMPDGPAPVDLPGKPAPLSEKESALAAARVAEAGALHDSIQAARLAAQLLRDARELEGLPG